jgi:mono/diheme cytochrome c family protein
VNDGVYSKDQAGRGAKLFESNCSTCHDPSRFTGPEFISQWSDKPLHALFDVMSTTMPEDNPGALKPQQYGDVVAYFLELNGYPEGAEDLPGTAEALKAVRMEPKK